MATWNQGNSTYQVCLASLHVETQKTPHDLLTQLGSLKEVQRPLNNQVAKWKRIEFDLEAPRKYSGDPKIPAIFSIEISYYMVNDNSNSLGFKVRNPKIKLKNQDYNLKITQGLKLRIEAPVQVNSPGQYEIKEVEIDSFSQYLNLQKVVSSSAETLVIEDRFKDVETIVPLPGFDSLFDRISFYFENIEATDNN